MWFMHNFGGGWWTFGMGFLMVIFWGGLIGLAVWGIIRLVRHGGCCVATTVTTTQNANDIARERYAKGELTKEQFEQLKKDLSQK